jgi:hypothetical protein
MKSPIIEALIVGYYRLGTTNTRLKPVRKITLIEELYMFLGLGAAK